MDLKSTAEKNNLINYLTEYQKIPLDYYDDTTAFLDVFNNYDAEIFFVDREIKRIFDYMDKKELNTHTLWAITADHGEGLGNHYFYGHGKYLYNEQVNIPLILYFSDKRYDQKEITEIIRHVDILPTFSELIGYPIAEAIQFIQGYSLIPLLKEENNSFPAKYSFSQRRPKDNDNRKEWEPGRIYCLQNLRYKYIYHSQGKDEFYDLVRDPFELENLIDIPSRIKREIEIKLKDKYKTMSMQSKDCAPRSVDKKYLQELKALGYF